MKHLIFSASAAILMAACTATVSNTNNDEMSEAAYRLADAQAEALSRNPDVKRLLDMAENGRYGYDITESLTTEIGPQITINFGV